MSGETELVTNCQVLCEGWDQPAVSCCVLARPTKSIGLYRQMAGRVIRPAPGKADALILDHAGATFAHGFIEDPVAWTLDPDDRARNAKHQARCADAKSRMLDCAQCGAIRTAGEACRSCGFYPACRAEYVAVADGELVHVDRNGRMTPNECSPEQRRVFHGMLTAIAHERGYKIGWASHKYRERFGQWSTDRAVEPRQPSPEVRSWVRSRQIAFAKAMQKAADA